MNPILLEYMMKERQRQLHADAGLYQMLQGISKKQSGRNKKSLLALGLSKCLIAIWNRIQKR